MLNSQIVFVVLIVVLLVTMVTLGSVLLVGFFFVNRLRQTRVLAAAIFGTLLSLGPILFFSNFENGEFVEPMGLIAAILIISMAILGWPIAYFATKKLDRLTQFDAKVFE